MISTADMTLLKNTGPLPFFRAQCVHFAGGIGGRLDHTLGNLSSLHAHRDTRIVLCGDDNIVKLVPKGRSVIRPCRAVEGPHCGLVPYNGPDVATAGTQQSVPLVVDLAF